MMTFLQELGDLWWFIGIAIFLIASWFALKWAGFMVGWASRTTIDRLEDGRREWLRWGNEVQKELVALRIGAEQAGAAALLLPMRGPLPERIKTLRAQHAEEVAALRAKIEEQAQLVHAPVCVGSQDFTAEARPPVRDLSAPPPCPGSCTVVSALLASKRCPVCGEVFRQVAGLTCGLNLWALPEHVNQSEPSEGGAPTEFGTTAPLPGEDQRRCWTITNALGGKSAQCRLFNGHEEEEHYFGPPPAEPQEEGLANLIDRTVELEQEIPLSPEEERRVEKTLERLRAEPQEERPHYLIMSAHGLGAIGCVVDPDEETKAHIFREDPGVTLQLVGAAKCPICNPKAEAEPREAGEGHV